MSEKEACVVSISHWDTLRIHAISCVIGSWVVFRRLVRSLWSPLNLNLQDREKPPQCLVDSSLGQHSYIKVKGAKLHYVEAGSRSKPMLLLLHGFPDCWLTWRYQIPALVKHFRVVALDLKGFGDSDKPAWRRSYRVDTLLAELKELITALGTSSCTVVAHDLGALLCWYLAHQYPDIVEKFVCISCPHPNVYWSTVPRESVFNSSWISFSQLPYLPETEALRNGLSIINQRYPHLQKKSDADDYLVANKYAFSRKEDWTGAINYFRNLPFQRISPVCEPVKAPCMFITGNRDPCLTLESIVTSTEFTEKFLVKIVNEAGHYPHQEKPEVVNKMIISFLNVNESPEKVDKPVQKGLMDRMFGAVASTVKYGNQMFDVVQKTSNIVPGLQRKSSVLGQSAS
ncbi:epoxide hydrolase 4-like isoform X1 [Schistocerca piceifrons]|uniref:epoxide hydrolase 4-like isoform X1 n=1 Tax=Schistocerca piceifrons TaxID=274613 RepID=UPI001F5FD996|nr:epoxide hydrolase 4-like isoform X1 [Schistocerca piceifrons]